MMEDDSNCVICGKKYSRHCYCDDCLKDLFVERKKIEEIIEHFEFLGSTGDNYAKNVVKKLKSILEDDK